jgi:hypothetical protein
VPWSTVGGEDLLEASGSGRAVRFQRKWEDVTVSVSRLQRAPEEKPREMIPIRVACADWLGVHPNTGYTMRRQDRFPVEVITMGGRYFCRRADLERYTHRREEEAV